MKKLIIIAVAAVLVLSGALAGVIAFLNTPERVAARALTGVLEDLEKREELAPLSKVLTKGSISFKADGDALEELMGDDFSVEGKLYFNETAAMLDDLSIRYGSMKLTGGMYFDEDRFYVKNSEILDGAWGIQRGTLEKEWKDSVFAPNSGSEVELEEDIFNVISEVLSALDEEMDKELIKDMEKFTNRYGKKAWALFCEYAEFESETDDVRINKERKNARVITITLDGDAIAAMVEEMVEYILEDDKLKDLVVKYGDRFADLLEEYADIEDISDAYDDLMEKLEDSADDLVDSVEDAITEDVVITMVTPTMSSKLLMLTAEYDDNEIVSVNFGHEGVRKTNNISVKIAGMYDVEYDISENTKDEYKASLEVMGEKVATIEIDKDKETYELELVDICIVEGDMSSKGKTHTITVDKVVVYEDSWDYTYKTKTEYKDMGITLTIAEKDKMPEVEEDVDSILSITDEDLEKWADKLEKMISDYPDDIIGDSDSDEEESWTPSGR